MAWHETSHLPHCEGNGYKCTHSAAVYGCNSTSVQLEEANSAKEEDVALRKVAEEGYLEMKEKVNTPLLLIIIMHVH